MSDKKPNMSTMKNRKYETYGQIPRIIGKAAGVSIICILVAIQGRSFCGTELHPSLKDSLLVLNESWAMLDRVGEKSWSGWDSYRDEIFFTAIPHIQDKLINPPYDPGNGFRSLSQSLSGKRVYLREPGRSKKVWGGSYRFKIGRKRFKGVQFRPPSIAYSKEQQERFRSLAGLKELPENVKNYFHSVEFYIGFVVHEAFHSFSIRRNRRKVFNIKHPTSFKVNDRYEFLLNLEGEILEKAYNTHGKSKLQVLSRQFLAVREERRKYLTEIDVGWERRNEYLEGAAQYVETKVFKQTAKQANRSKQKGFITVSFFSEDLEPVLDKLMTIHIRKHSNSSSESGMLEFCYYSGAIQGFILDRIYPEWKSDFFKEDVYFETLLADASGCKKEKQKVYLRAVMNSAR